MSSEAASKAQNAQATMPGIHIAGMTITIIDLLYLGMLIFLLYQVVRAIRMERKLEEPKYSFSTRPKSINMVLMSIIFIFGVMTIVSQKEYARGVMMMFLGITFYFSSKNKVIVSREGLFADNKFIPWQELRKWAWDTKTGNLVIITKEFGKNETRQVLQIGRTHMSEINTRIREFKLGKKSAMFEEKAQEKALSEEEQASKTEQSETTES